MKVCNQCAKEKDYIHYGKDKATKDEYKNKCKECERENRGTARKNINNVVDAQAWLDKNYSKYKILQWGGSKEKSLILDKDRNVQFEYMWYRFKDKVQKYPSRNFNATKEEANEARKKVFLEKYGVVAPLQKKEFREKSKQTQLERYGVNNVMKSKEIKEKVKQTNLEKYGVESYSQTSEYKNKTRQTNLEKYSVKHPVQNKQVNNKISNTKAEKRKKKQEKERKQKLVRENEKTGEKIRKAQDWLNKNFPRYKILEWGGGNTKKSKFYDFARNVEFETDFNTMKKRLRKKPNTIFGATQEERMNAIYSSVEEQYGAKNVFQLPEFHVSKRFGSSCNC